MKLNRNETVVIASHNPGKIREIRALLSSFPLIIKSAADFNLTEPEETGTTFVENALLKARHAMQATKHTALADDSGLQVFALKGQPGIHSARWGGADKNFQRAINRVQEQLNTIHATDYSAQFVCVLALVTPTGESVVYEGLVQGTLTFPPRGSQGFGYDPIFIAEGETKTYGELSLQQKEATNHRARAFQQLKQALQIV